MPTLKEIIKTYGAIPPLTSFKRPMFIGPHPDDIEYGCGGIISKYSELGIPVTFVIVTDGAAGGKGEPESIKEMRYEESKNAASFLGVENVEFCDLEDGGIYTVEDALKRIIPYVLEYKPDIIFGPDSRLLTECHPDHLKVGEAVRQLTQIVPYKQSLIRHGIDVSNYNDFPNNITLALYFSDNPNYIEEISEKNLREKINALLIHCSQMKDSSSELLLNYFKLKAVALGEKNHTALGEDYQILVPLCRHVYSEGVHYNDWE